MQWFMICHKFFFFFFRRQTLWKKKQNRKEKGANTFVVDIPTGDILQNVNAACPLAVEAHRMQAWG